MRLLVALLLAFASAVSADDSPPSCAFWCTRDSGGSDAARCGHPECAACDACSGTKSCTPQNDHDLTHEACENWCKASYSAVHCKACSCKSCSFCGGAGAATFSSALAPSAPAKECKPTARDDGKVESCKSWCQEKHASSGHCTRCDCKSCPFCSATALAAAAVAAEAAASEKARAAASRKPSSSAAASAASPPPPRASCKPSSKDDLSYESCSIWCKAEHRGSHCVSCACKSCGFCGGNDAPGDGEGRSSKGGGAVGPSGGGKACEPIAKDDASVEGCAGFCLEKHASSHCTRCSCKGCGFCGKERSCTPASGSDSAIAACEGFCSEERSKEHCPQCRCKRCGFCMAGGHVATACTPHDANDVRCASRVHSRRCAGVHIRPRARTRR